MQRQAQRDGEENEGNDLCVEQRKVHEREGHHHEASNRGDPAPAKSVGKMTAQGNRSHGN